MTFYCFRTMNTVETFGTFCNGNHCCINLKNHCFVFPKVVRQKFVGMWVHLYFSDIKILRDIVYKNILESYRK